MKVRPKNRQHTTSHGNHRGPRLPRRGLTLVELLVVIVIIAMLMAILIPTFGSVRETARRTQCSNNAKQLITALQTSASASGVFPAGTTFLNVTPTSENNTWCRGGDSNGYTPWTVAVLPFLEQQDVYDNFTFGLVPEGRFMEANFTVPLPNGAPENMVPLAVLQCPSSSHFANPLRNNYFGVQGAVPVSCTNDGSATRRFYINGVLYANSQVSFAHLRDGASHVLVLGETRWCSHLSGGVERFNWLMSGKAGNDATPCQLAGVEFPINTDVSGTGSLFLNFASRGFGGDHFGGCYFAFADGSIRFFQESIDLSLLRLLAGRNDGGLIQNAFQ